MFFGLLLGFFLPGFGGLGADTCLVDVWLGADLEAQKYPDRTLYLSSSNKLFV